MNTGKGVRGKGEGLVGQPRIVCCTSVLAAVCRVDEKVGDGDKQERRRLIQSTTRE